MKLELKHFTAYINSKPMCSYVDCSSNRRRKAYLTGISSSDGVETTYKRKIRGCSGDLIGLVGHNNIIDLKFKLHLRPLSDFHIYEAEFAKFYGENDDSLWELVANSYDNLEDILNYPYYTIQFILKKHGDVFNLIKQGLAIDIKTLK